MTAAYDAIVIGGGPAGATSALLLAAAGWRVALVERAQFPRRKVCGEFISATTWPLLERLGVASSLALIAGPPVTHVGLWAGDAALSARLDGTPATRGRALGREHLDAALLGAAVQRGAEAWQPWELLSCARTTHGYACTIAARDLGATRTLESALIIAAHGSWESGPLSTQRPRRAPRAADLLGFKAHFADAALPAGLMPLLAFPGGYGGMVASDGGRTSLSCCIRRDALAACRARWPGRAAGPALLAHVSDSCTAVAAALADATPDGRWLAAGPLDPGIRGFGEHGTFAVGNAAAEAHPVIAEGISMAIQSAALLAESLLPLRDRGAAGLHDAAALAAGRARYAARWRASFSPRLYAAAAFAHLFMRPLTTTVATVLVRRVPRLLTEGARWSGKSSLLHWSPRVDPSAS